MARTIARKEYENGRFGTQSASIEYDDGMRDFGRGPEPFANPQWVVLAWDRWAYTSLADAKAHYRAIG